MIRFTSNKKCLSPLVAFSSNAFFSPSRADGHSCSFKGKNQIRLRHCPRRVQITIMNFRAGVRNHCALFISHFETVVFCSSNSKVGSMMLMVMVAVIMLAFKCWAYNFLHWLYEVKMLNQHTIDLNDALQISPRWTDGWQPSEIFACDGQKT